MALINNKFIFLLHPPTLWILFLKRVYWCLLSSQPEGVRWLWLQELTIKFIKEIPVLWFFLFGFEFDHHHWKGLGISCEMLLRVVNMGSKHMSSYLIHSFARSCVASTSHLRLLFYWKGIRNSSTSCRYFRLENILACPFLVSFPIIGCRLSPADECSFLFDGCHFKFSTCFWAQQLMKEKKTTRRWGWWWYDTHPNWLFTRRDEEVVMSLGIGIKCCHSGDSEFLCLLGSFKSSPPLAPMSVSTDSPLMLNFCISRTDSNETQTGDEEGH